MTKQIRIEITNEDIAMAQFIKKRKLNSAYFKSILTNTKSQVDLC